MVVELDVNERQLKELRAKAVEASKEFDDQMLELKRKLRQELTDTLNDEQKNRLKALLGKSFDWNEAWEKHKERVEE